MATADNIVTAFSLSNDSIRLTNRITDEYKDWRWSFTFDPWGR